MSKTSRYILLAVGVLIFLLLAPLIILYVTGLKYDVKSGKFVHTGLLALRSDPSSVQVQLNGQTIRQSDGDMKFLNPGEYNLTLQKPGYQSWSKRFFIQADQVTWANPAPNRLFLFKQNSQPSQVASNILAMDLASSNLLYLDQYGLTIAPINNPNVSQHFNLPKAATNITASPDDNSFIFDNVNPNSEATSTAYFFNLKTKQLVNVASLFAAPFKLQFSDSNNLYALADGTVYAINPSASSTTAVVSSAQSFTVSGDNIYYLQETKTHSSLMLQPLNGGQPQLLLAGLPTFTKAEIYINFQKQVLVLLDDALYRISNTPMLVTSGVTGVHFDGANLLVLHSGELDNYNYGSQNLDFITRTSQQLSNFVLRSDMGYAFLFKDKTLEALELDLRDHQNEYDFYQAQNPQSFFVSDDGRNLYILDGGNILVQNIR